MDVSSEFQEKILIILKNVISDCSRREMNFVFDVFCNFTSV